MAALVLFPYLIPYFAASVTDDQSVCEKSEAASEKAHMIGQHQPSLCISFWALSLDMNRKKGP
jgi:hypothetical protein